MTQVNFDETLNRLQFLVEGPTAGVLWCALPISVLLARFRGGGVAVVVGALVAIPASWLTWRLATRVGAEAGQLERAQDTFALAMASEFHMVAALALGAWLLAVTVGAAPRARQDDRAVLEVVAAGMGSLVAAYGIAVATHRLTFFQLLLVLVAGTGIAVLAHGRLQGRQLSATRGLFVAVAVAATWASGHVALVAESFGLGSGAPVADVLRPIDEAPSLWVTGSGVTVGLVLVGLWIAPEVPFRVPKGIVVSVGAWILVILAPVPALFAAHSVAVGGRFNLEGVALPRAHGTLAFPTGTCVGSEPAPVARFPGVPCAGPLLWIGDANDPAIGLFASGTPGPHQLLVQLPANGLTRGPMLQADMAGVDVELWDEPMPTVFEEGTPALDQLDHWITGLRPGTLAPVWIVDSEEGPMLMMHGGRGLPLVDGARRARVLREYLAEAEGPAIVLAVSTRWTLQQVVDLCLDARRATPERFVACLIVPTGLHP